MNIGSHLVPLVLGMAKNADLGTGCQRGLDYLLSLVLEVASQAMRER